MKKTLFLALLLLSGLSCFAQTKNFAVGFRLGEPGGLNIRKYLRDRAIDVNIGTYGGFWGNVRKYGKEGHYKNVGLAINANMLWYIDLFGKENFQGYYGFGGQINSRRSYPERLAGNYEKTIALGGSGLAGIEYFVDNQPISVFLDAGLYAEVLPVPLFMHPQGGLGVRFNF